MSSRPSQTADKRAPVASGAGRGPPCGSENYPASSKLEVHSSRARCCCPTACTLPNASVCSSQPGMPRNSPKPSARQPWDDSPSNLRHLAAPSRRPGQPWDDSRKPYSEPHAYPTEVNESRRRAWSCPRVGLLPRGSSTNPATRLYHRWILLFCGGFGDPCPASTPSPVGPSPPDAPDFLPTICGK